MLPICHTPSIHRRHLRFVLIRVACLNNSAAVALGRLPGAHAARFSTLALESMSEAAERIGGPSREDKEGGTCWYTQTRLTSKEDGVSKEGGTSVETFRGEARAVAKALYRRAIAQIQV